MKTALTIFITTFAISFLAGCNGTVAKKEPLLEEGKTLLTVDFEENQTLRYRFTCRRNIELNWNVDEKASKTAKSKIDKFSEQVEMVIAYRPVEIDTYGLTTVKATCESVSVQRSSTTGRRAASGDAVSSLKGKTFTLTITPEGKIEDYSQLEKLIKELGKKAFRKDASRGRIKEPDMIGDFFATQWFLWDSVSSIKKPTEGLSVGQSWNSKLSVPTPMVTKIARDVTYTLEQIRDSKKGQLAVIRSTYSLSLAEKAPRSWPMPYSGSFQMSGIFGFLTRFTRGFKAVDLKGQGRESFNIDAGRIESYNQSYQVQLAASSPSSLPSLNPQITIKQTLTMRLLEN